MSNFNDKVMPKIEELRELLKENNTNFVLFMDSEELGNVATGGVFKEEISEEMDAICNFFDRMFDHEEVDSEGEDVSGITN